MDHFWIIFGKTWFKDLLPSVDSGWDQNVQTQKLVNSNPSYVTFKFTGTHSTLWGGVIAPKKLILTRFLKEIITKLVVQKARFEI